MLTEGPRYTYDNLFRVPETVPAEPFTYFVNKGIEAALSEIVRKYDPTELQQGLHYHSSTHTRGVITRVGMIAEAMDLSPREIAITRLAAAFHDVYQFSKLTDKGRGREYARGINEEYSANLLSIYMDHVNKERAKASKQRVFEDEEIANAREAVFITIPTISYNGELNVVQERFTQVSSPVAQAVALADLGGPGMEGISTAKWEALALFTEQHPNLYRSLKRNKGRRRKNKRILYKSHYPEDVFKSDILNWINTQVGFAKLRRNRLKSDMDNINISNNPNGVRSLFTHFDHSIYGLSVLYEQYEDLDAQDIFSDLISTLDNPPEYALTLAVT